MADDLMTMFNTMGTTDHNELIRQFLDIVPGAPADAAQFFLEANSMNLQAAIMCYMDQGGTGAVSQAMALPEAKFVCDVTIGEGEEVSPGTQFQKTWRLANVGSEAWPEQTSLVFVQGEQLGGQAFVRVPPLEAGNTLDISVDLKSPTNVGTYAGSWRLCTQVNGVPNYFGEEIWVLITVSESGMLDALQRMHGTSIDAQGGQVNPLMAMGGQSLSLFGQQPGPSSAMEQQMMTAEAQPQQDSSMLFAVPNFGSLSSHSFGANRPDFGTSQEPGQQEDGMES